MKHLEKVSVSSKDFKKYKKFTPKLVKRCQSLADKIKNKKIIHINSTQLGGGVSELLRTQVPLEKDLGVNSQWFIIKDSHDFFAITKKIHNLLQGKKGSLTQKEKDFYINWTKEKISPSFKELLSKEKPDLIVIHDPQPLPLIDYTPKEVPSIFRFHIDLSRPNQETFNFLKPLVQKYQSVIFTHPSYKPKWIKKKNSKIIMPAIDPFSTKNQLIKKNKAEKILTLYNIHTEKPLISQVSRFDPWKDPLGALKAYYIAKNEIPDLQLILAGIFQANDDPEAREMFEKVKKQAKGDPEVFLFAEESDLRKLSNDKFISAVYTASDAVMQKSLKEGFGMTVTEAMWKGKPVVGGDTKGIGLQIKHKKNGYLVESPEEAAKYLVKLLQDKKLTKKIGQAAHESVRKNFLFSRYILDNLKSYKSLI
mgnify:FL=1